MRPLIRILYAEDNPQDVDLLVSHFNEYAPGFEIAVVNTGQSCLDRLQEDKFDLLLLDHRLPDMEGSEVLRTLVRNHIHIPVVLITGSGDESLVISALRLGAATYIPKVGNYLETMRDILLSVIKKHLLELNQNSSMTQPAHILYAEDNPSDADMTLQYFSEVAPNYTVDVVNTGADALKCLGNANAYDMALFDLRLAKESGLELIRAAKTAGYSLPPFIVLSGLGDDASAIAALQLGAAKYIPKRDGYLSQLVYSIDHAISSYKLKNMNQLLQTELAERKRVEKALRENETQLQMAMSELQQRENIILQQATHDELTGLPNRRLFYDRLKMAILEARRYDRRIAIVFIDLDHFKPINDTLGHQAGDKFLIAIADQIKTVPREVDTCARLGGDEFALILSSVDGEEKVGLVTQRILEAIGREFVIDGVSLKGSASLGVAIFPDDADDLAILLNRADVAMYKSKQNGGNTCRFWDKTMISD